MENGFVDFTIENNIGIITFGHPKSNSLPEVILEKLASTILEVSSREEAKIILLKSEGERTFCAGASFDELLQIEKLSDSKLFFGGFAKVLTAMRTCGKIIVARVQGKVAGGGVGIVAAADYCFATKHSSVALTEINIGIGPFVIGPYVERKIGKGELTAMSLDASFRRAEWAKARGLYQNVAETITEMDFNIRSFLEELSQKSTKALSNIKKVAWEGTEYFEKLMPERIMMSAELILQEDAKKSLALAKEKLSSKK